MNENEIYIQTINTVLLRDKILCAHKFKLKPNQGLRVDPDGILLNKARQPEPVFVDQDCCYGFMNKHLYHNNKVQYTFFIPVFLDFKKPSGLMKMRTMPNFYIPLGAEDFQALKGEILTLREFMGSRYKYNPRVDKNMREFLNDVCKQLK